MPAEAKNPLAIFVFMNIVVNSILPLEKKEEIQYNGVVVGDNPEETKRRVYS